ncbi:MAG: zinc-dependent alcohol dehydrogenase [Ardenticatenaceae bacterium]
MKRTSLYFTAPYNVSVREEPLPLPAPDEVLVKTMVSGISPGTEMVVYRGQMPTDLLVDDTIATLGGVFSFPLKYGYAAVGRVIAIGVEVNTDWQGQIVFGFNPHESHFLASPEDLLPIPASLSPEIAVLLPQMEMAVSFLMDGQPMIGEQVAVFGQGIVGLLTTKLLAKLPLASLVTLDRYSLRREWSLKQGAHFTLDPMAPNALPQLRQVLQNNRPYGGADLTYELSGNPEALDQAIEGTGFNGRIIVGSWYGQKQADLNLGGHFHRSHMRLISSQVQQIAPRWRGRWDKTRRLQMAWSMLEQHASPTLITHRFSITRAKQAYQLLDWNPGDTLQVIFTYE